jgi:hypothetical protein
MEELEEADQFQRGQLNHHPLCIVLSTPRSPLSLCCPRAEHKADHLTLCQLGQGRKPMGGASLPHHHCHEPLPPRSDEN